MPTIALKNQDGAAVGELELSDEVFGATVNEAAIHLVVRSQLAAKRQGTQSAQTRGEVRGGGRKIYRQKGTGNARHHSNRAPQFTHGGVVFAPKPRDYVIRVPRKVRRLALKGALTSKVLDGDMIVLDRLALTEPKTRLMAEVLKKLAVEKKALIVLPDRDDFVLRAASNLPGIKTAYVNTINVLDILGYEKFIITQDAVKLVEEVYAQ
jgi:large subunit ribosomal protein L4